MLKIKTSKMKRCCLNCAFCIRCKEYTDGVGLQVYRHDSKELLTQAEREKAYKNDFSFLGAEKRKQQEWEAEYERKINALKSGALNSVIGGPRVLEMIMATSTAVGKYSLAGQFKMSKHPEAPDDDYLQCWHDLWLFSQDEKSLNSLNDKTKCPFFFAYNKKGNKSFEGCEKERIALQDKNRFVITNVLVIAGIVVTIIVAIATYFINKGVLA